MVTMVNVDVITQPEYSTVNVLTTSRLGSL